SRRFSNSAANGTRVPRNTHAPPNVSGWRSTASQSCHCSISFPHTPCQKTSVCTMCRPLIPARSHTLHCTVEILYILPSVDSSGFFPRLQADVRLWVRRAPRVECPLSAPTLALAYWITSSARNRSVGGIVIPRALAVLRLITRSNFV